MMARTGTATFHHVMTLLTRAKMRMARKLTATKIAISTMVSTKPAPVTFLRHRSRRCWASSTAAYCMNAEALDRRDRDGLHVREEPEPDVSHAAEREVREPGTFRRRPGTSRRARREHRARRMTMTPAMTQARTAAPPTACAANSAPNSQPEPMIDVSDAQVAPISPSSRLKPTSVGVVTATPAVSAAMCHPLFRSCPLRASHPRRGSRPAG